LHPDLRSKSLRGPCFSFGSFFFPIARWRRGLQRVQKTSRCSGYLVNGEKKCILISFRRLVEPADLSDELQRRRADLVRSHRRIEVKKDFDVSAHAQGPQAVRTHMGAAQCSDLV
jgi:hypothetical protein